MTLKGIDVSAWQGTINWKSVKNAGISFAILKAGGSDDGIYTDSKWEYNYNECKLHGISVGAYWFVGKGCVTAADGTADAERFLKLLKGKKLDYPVYIDVEVTPINEKKGATDATIAFCKTMEKAGWYTGIYGSTYSTFQSRLDDSRLTGYAHWIAQYANSCTYWDSYGIWQYSSGGYVPGISGRVDMNYCYVDYPSIIKAKGLNGYQKTTEAPKETPKKTQLSLLKVDGVFGQVSVKMLQRMLNDEIEADLDVDGIAGPATWASLQMYINEWVRMKNAEK